MHHWHDGDATVTIIVFLSALFDLSAGVWNIFFSENSLIYLGGFNESAITAELMQTAKVRGVGGIESGVAALLLGIYRYLRWRRGYPFNGQNFQLLFLVVTIGRSGTMYLERPAAGQEVYLGFYLQITRLVLSSFGLVSSIYFYRHSWGWLYDGKDEG